MKCYVLTFIGQFLALGNQLSQQLTIKWWIYCTMNASFILIATTVSMCVLPFNRTLPSHMTTIAGHRSAIRSTDCSRMAWHVSELIPSQYNIENGGFHSRTRIIWFIQSLCQFVRFDILLQSSAKEIKVDIFIRFYWKYSDITYFILLRAKTKKAITFQSVENSASLQKGKAFYTSFN